MKSFVPWLIVLLKDSIRQLAEKITKKLHKGERYEKENSK